MRHEKLLRSGLVVLGLMLPGWGIVEAGQATTPLLMSAEVAQETDAARREAAMRAIQRGMELYQQGTAESFQQALEQWQEALVLFRQIRDKRLEDIYGEAVTLSIIGKGYGNSGEYQKALNYYEQALSLFQVVSKPSNIADTLNSIGGMYSELGANEQALEYYNQALSIYESINDIKGIANILNNIGAVYADQSKNKLALDFLNRALFLREEIGDSLGIANTLNNIGFVYSNLWEIDMTIDYYEQALSILQSIGHDFYAATTLNNIGRVYSDLGEQQRALSYYNQALILHRAIGNRAGEANTLNNISIAYSNLSQNQYALDYANQALLLSQKINHSTTEAVALHTIGLVYNDLGENQRALEYLDRALVISQAIDNRKEQVKILNNIGGIFYSLGQLEEALKYYNQTLPLLQPINNSMEKVMLFYNISQIYYKLGRQQQALESYNQALYLTRDIGNRVGEAATLHGIGLVYSALGEKQQALDYYNQALSLSQAVGDREGEAITLYNRAILQRDQNQLQAALTDIEAAIAIIEDLRGEITNTDLRQTYFAQVQDQGYYQFYADLLMQLHQQNPTEGYDAIAFHVSERSRARTLIELLTEANVDFREGLDNPAAIELLDREQNLYNQIRAQETILGQRLQNGNIPEAEAKQAYLDTVRQLEDELNDIASQLKRLNPAYADLQYPEPLTLKEVQQQVLDDETVLLQYFLTEDQSYLWLVTADGYKTYTLPGQAEINEAVTAFRNGITTTQCVNAPNPDTCIKENIQDPGQKLYDLILSPVADEIAGKRLLIVGDGALQYTPFAALPLPNTANYQPLLSQHEIVAAPSSTTIATQRQRLQARPPAPKALAILADPVYSATDSRVTGEAPATPADNSNLVDLDSLSLNRSLCMPDATVHRLPGTRQEADAIRQYFPDSGVITAMDFQANQDWFDRTQLDQYQHLFLATHGCLDTENPEFSGLVLSLVDEQGQQQEDGFLRLGEIFTLNLAADLVVLSACETGLGDTIKGEGMVGMTRGFMYAGAERVVVSLWNVNDGATAELMSQFYDLMHRPDNPLTPAAALREAQLQLWEQYQDPRLWAAFTLQGEWQ